MNFDIYRNRVNTNRFLIVPTGTNISTLSGIKTSQYESFRTNISFGGPGVIGLNSEQLSNDIETQGFSIQDIKIEIEESI